MLAVPVAEAATLEGSKPEKVIRQRPYAVIWAETAKLRGKPYATARARMLKQGWKPFTAKHFEGDSFCADDVCKNNPELIWCNLAGKVACELGFFKSSPRRYRVVIVDGERPRGWTIISVFSPARDYIHEWFHRRPGWP
jgi:hypothetical protein